MKTITEHIRRRLLDSAGIFDAPKPVAPHEQWDSHFETLMRNRMQMGALRYGHFRDSMVSPSVRTGSMRRRIKRYLETGNTENLVDVANLCLIEFCTSTHRLRHFRPIDGDEADTSRVAY